MFAESNASHSPCMLSSLCSTVHNPSTTPDRSAHHGRSAYHPSTEFASTPLSSNTAVHRRRISTMICFCIPFCSLSFFLAVIRLFHDSHASPNILQTFYRRRRRRFISMLNIRMSRTPIEGSPYIIILVLSSWSSRAEQRSFVTDTMVRIP